MAGHRLLTAAAARLGLAASASTPAIVASTPAVTPAPAATTPAGEDDTVDVITLADAQAAVAAAEIRGATAERERTNAVLASDAGKANPQMAAFMLNANPNTAADAIVGQLAAMPKAEAPAPAPAALVETPAAPAAITTPLTLVPKIETGTTPPADADADPKEIADSWDKSIAAAGGASFGGPLANGVPRTGN
jgi:hypothetical protein